MHPKNLKGLSLGFQFFEYLSFEFEYFANLLQKKKFMSYGFEYKF